MERLHPMMKYGNFIEVYNNIGYRFPLSLSTLGRTHEKQWIRRSESTSVSGFVYESTAFECVLRHNTPQTNRHFL